MNDQSIYVEPIIVNPEDDAPPTVHYPLVQEIKEEKFESSQIEGEKIIEPLKTFDLVSYIAFVFAVFFFFYSIIMFSVPCNKYNKIKAQNPKTTYFPIPAYVIALHFTFHICIITSLIILGFRKKINCGKTANFIIIFVPFVVSLIFWIAYGASTGCDFFYTEISKALSPDAYERYVNQTKDSLPEIYYSASSPAYNSTGEQEGYCSMATYTVSSSSSVDQSHYPNVSEIGSDLIYLRSELGVEFDSRSESLSTQIKNQILNCAPYVLYFNSEKYTCRNWGYSVEYGIPGLKTNQFVIKKPYLPPEVDTATRVAKGIFWAPVAFIYDLARLAPQSNVNLKKMNTSMNIAVAPSCREFSYSK